MKLSVIKINMKRLMCLSFIFGSFLFAYGQTSIVNTERANDLSNLAKKYLDEGNYCKAIDCEKQSMDIIATLYGINSLEYASSSIIISHYLYLKGCYESSHNVVADNSFDMAVKKLMIAMDYYNNNVLGDFKKLSSQEKYKLWQKVCPLYDRLFPCYVAKIPTDSFVSELYNSVLFSKGATWRNFSHANNRDWREIQRILNSDEIAIEFISPVDLVEDNIIFYALILTKTKSPRMVRLFDLIQLNQALRNASSKYEKNLEIGKLTWGNLKKELQGINTIYFSATHVLHNIPFEYSPVEGSIFYNEKYNMCRLSSTLELVSRGNRMKYRSAVLFGGLDYEYNLDGDTEKSISRAGLERLYNTDIEVNEISKSLNIRGIKNTVYKGTEGTESAFKSLSGKPISILHLSTHGRSVSVEQTEKYTTEDNALLNSYLALSGANKKLVVTSTETNNDGIITALDISRMDFNGLDLVCMSACVSALGTYSDDDGILGLQKGFKVAGANTIIMSVDKVDDEATKILMVEFYKNLMSGRSKLESLRNAQKYLRQVNNGKYDDPRYWASFIMLDGLN